MIAAKFNHCDTIKLLVDNKADVYLVNEGYTAMEVAAKNN
jgi:ankyrin repeat protein